MEARFREGDAMRRANPETAAVQSPRRANRPFISFALVPAYGHVYPVIPLAEAVRQAGARVQIAVGRPFHDTLPLPTVLGSDLDPITTDVPDLTRARFPTVVDDVPARWVAAFFGVMHALPAVTALRRAWQHDRPDLVVYDPANPGAAVVADELGIPSMLFSVFHYFPPMLELPRVTRRALDEPDVQPWEPLPDGRHPSRPYIDPVPSALQLGPIAEHDDVIPIRTVAWDDPAAAPIVPTRRDRERPLVYVTLGTVVGTPELLRDVIVEAARFGDVIASIGPSVSRARLGDLPGNVSVHRLVQAHTVMATADLVVHHGGMGTTLAAAAHAVPQLLLPQVGDQFANAQAVTRAAIGRALIGAREAGAISAALAALERDRQVRDSADAVARTIAAAPGPAQVARELINRAGHGQPRRRP